MSVPKMKDIQALKWYAGAAYCPQKMLKRWKCSYCSKINPRTEYITTFINSTLEAEGFIAADNIKKRIILSFRGTANDANMFGNIQVKVVPFNGAPNYVRVHEGFLNNMESMAGQFVPRIRTMLRSAKYKKYDIFVVGHSLGGAIAVLASIRLQHSLRLPWSRFQIFTYGQPRTGTVPFAHWFNDKPVKVARVVNNNDIVPHLIGGTYGYFAHHQNEIFIEGSGKTLRARRCSNFILEDPTCSNKYGNFEYSAKPHNIYFDMDINSAC